jgi:hypothetical protein
VLGRHQSEIGHLLGRIGKTRKIAQFGDRRAALTNPTPRIVCSVATTAVSVQSGNIAAICAVSRSRRASVASTA